MDKMLSSHYFTTQVHKQHTNLPQFQLTGWLLPNNFLTGGIHTVLAETGEAGEVKWLTGPWQHQQGWLSLTITLWPSHPVHGPGPCHAQCSLTPWPSVPTAASHSPAQMGHGHSQARPHSGLALHQPQHHGPGSPHHSWSWHSLQLPHCVLEINTSTWNKYQHVKIIQCISRAPRSKFRK